MGRFEEGIASIKQALAINKNPGPFDGVFLAVEEYRKKNYRQALAILETMPDSFYAIPATKAACYGELGDPESARPYIAKLLKLRPNYADEMRRDARGSHYVQSFIDAYADGLKKAGLEIADDDAPVGSLPQPNEPR
jgi:tetratricopeptide (TPR) repeat protein